MRNAFKFSRIYFFALVFFMPAQPVLAAAQVEITNISDFSLGTWNMGDPDITAHFDMCVYSGGNTPAGGYAINVSSSGGFVLKNGSRSIPYTLTWDNGGAGNLGAGSTSLTSNTPLTGQLHANTSSPLCVLSNPTARLNIKVAATDMATALAGNYTGTITLTLSPN